MNDNRTLWINRYCAAPFGQSDLPADVRLVSDRAISYWPADKDITIPASLVRMPDGRYALYTSDGIVDCDQEEAYYCAYKHYKWELSPYFPYLASPQILLDGEDWDFCLFRGIEIDEIEELLDIFRRRESGTITPDYRDDIADVYGRWTIYDYDGQWSAAMEAGCRTDYDFRAYYEEHYSRWMNEEHIKYFAGLGADFARDMYCEEEYT